MAPFAFLALLLAAANPDLPIGRGAPPAVVAPAQAPATPAAASPAAGIEEVSLAPSDDYGYVAFCYGAESGYLKLYDQVMPEVERIERTFPGATPIDQALAEYPQLRSESQAHLTAYAAALTAAEKASPQAIAPRGLQVIRQGRSTWDGAASATVAQTAQAWMGWAAPEDCADRATALADRSRLQSAVLQSGASQSAGQGAVELDRLANPPALAAAPARVQPPPPAPTAPQPLALRGSAPAPSVVAASPAPAAATDLGVSFVGAPVPPAPAGLGVSFDSSAAPLAATSASPAIPSGLPPLIAPPVASPAPDPPSWRGIL
ncbi:MAG: hypothetical protein JWM33_1363 [Caulobacteraceae bacterium]|nr:hypothetical protein [Caulobacteraceae bacterium]